MCIKREKKQHMKIGERNVMTTSSNIYVYININKNTRFVITIHKNNVSKQERKEKIEKVLTTSLKKINTPPNKNISYTNSPPKYITTLIPKLLPLFVMNDKGKVTEKQSSLHWWKS